MHMSCLTKTQAADPKLKLLSVYRKLSILKTFTTAVRESGR